MANGGAQIALRLLPPLAVETIVPIRVYPTYKEHLVFDPTFECEVSCFRPTREASRLGESFLGLTNILMNPLGVGTGTLSPSGF